jgi:aspartyl protease family protein
MSDRGSTLRMGRGMSILCFLVLLGLLTGLFNKQLRSLQHPNQDVVTYSKGESKEIVLRANTAGHYLVQGAIEGHPVIFLVDTGASDIALSKALASKLGAVKRQISQAQTANGVIRTWRTVFDRVTIGGIEIRNVSASILPNSGTDEVLLGMSFLRHLEMIQKNGTLTLRQFSGG